MNVIEIRELLDKRAAGDELAGYQAFRRIVKVWPEIEALIVAAHAYEYVWAELSADLRDFILSEAPDWVRAALPSTEGEP